MQVARGSVLVLDGGMGMELTKHSSFAKGDPLWGSGMVYTHPDAVRSVHLGFLAAGADIIETNTYQASVPVLCKQFGLEVSGALDVMSSAARLAREVAEDFAKAKAMDAADGTDLPRDAVKPAIIAGAIGPYGASLCDRSEYHGDYVDAMSEEQLMDWHRPRVGALLNAGVDVLALETIPAKKEADALVRLLREFPAARAWMSFSCKGKDSTAHGELLSDAAKAAFLSDQVQLLGVNCVTPASVSSLLESLGPEIHRKGLIAYPDGIDTAELTGVPLLIESWVKQGALVVGGCCGMSPAQISSIRKAVDRLRDVPAAIRT